MSGGSDAQSTSKVDSNFAATVRVRHFLESTSKVDTVQADGRAASSEADGGQCNCAGGGAGSGASDERGG